MAAIGLKGKLEEAGVLYLRAIRIQEKALGPDHSDLASSLSNRANVLWAQVIDSSFFRRLRSVDARNCGVFGRDRTLLHAVWIGFGVLIGPCRKPRSHVGPGMLRSLPCSNAQRRGLGGVLETAAISYPNLTPPMCGHGRTLLTG